jgi:protocatechuate 3,4-dioxygenase beta subunit
MPVRAAGQAMVAAAFLIGASASPAHALQRSTRDRPQPKPIAPASISGAVTSQADNAPVARARVVLSADGTARTRVTLSDAQGRFEFADVPPGDYDALVMRSGYALVGGPARGLPIRVAAGEQRTGVSLVLQRAGTIPGRIEDEDGSPLAGAQVEALSLRSSDRQPALLSAAQTSTDDRGEFRLTGLPAGQYYVVGRDAAFARAGDEGGALRYPPTYFPGVVTAAEAKSVSVAVGAESLRADFRIRIIKPSHVSGQLNTSDKRALISGAVVLVPRDGAALQPVPSEDVDIRPDGRFRFRNVPPGKYQLRARAAIDPAQVLQFGSYAVSVKGGEDLTDLMIDLAPGAAIYGQIEWTGQAAGSPAARRGLRVRAPFADGTSFGDALTGDVAANGTFRLRGVMTGAHFFAIEGLQEPWALTGVRVRGRDTQLRPIDVHEGEQLPNVQLLVTTSVTGVSGTVTDASGRPAADALILVAPPGSTAWAHGDPRFHATRTDPGGRYRVRGLPPGAYRVAAMIAMDELAAWQPEWLQRIDAHGQAVSLAAAAPQTLDVVAVSPQALTAAVSR